MDQSRASFLSRLAQTQHVKPRGGGVIRRAHHPEIARVPRFLRPRPQGGWAKPGQPVRIRGFDLKQDILAISLPPDMPMPRLTLEEDAQSAIVTLRGNGHMLARVYDAPKGMTLRHVRVACHARG